jgi:hypothetical protein
MGSRTAQISYRRATCIDCVLSENDPTKREAQIRRISLRHLSKQHTLKSIFQFIRMAELKQIGAGQK